MLSQMDTGWAFASFISKGLTLGVGVKLTGMVGGAGNVVDFQVSGGKPLLPFTDPLPPEPQGDLPASKAPVSHALWSAGTDWASPAPSLEVLSARLDGVLSSLL